VRYNVASDVARAASTQLRPVSAPPAESSRRGPKRSTSNPWHGERNVCTTIRIEKVIWIDVRLACSDPISGCVNSVQTYCGLEITTMQTRPRSS
jgi:hypothetical protein